MVAIGLQKPPVHDPMHGPSYIKSYAAMRIAAFIFLLSCAVGVSVGSDTSLHKIQAMQTNFLTMPFVVQCNVSHGIGHFEVGAGQKNREGATLDIGVLWIRDGSNFISDCVVRPVSVSGVKSDSKSTFNFDVATNYFDSSKFGFYYGTSNQWSSLYWFYLKDFNLAK